MGVRYGSIKKLTTLGMATARRPQNEIKQFKKYSYEKKGTRRYESSGFLER